MEDKHSPWLLKTRKYKKTEKEKKKAKKVRMWHIFFFRIIKNTVLGLRTPRPPNN